MNPRKTPGGPGNHPGNRNGKTKLAPKEASEPTLKAILAALNSDGLEVALNKAGGSLKVGRAHLYGALAHCFFIACYLMDHPSMWADEFCRLPKWADFDGDVPDPKKPDQAIHFVFRAVCEKTRVGLNRASDYGLAVQHLYEIGIKPDNIVHELERRGGVSGVLKSRGPTDPDKSPKAATAETQPSLELHQSGSGNVGNSTDDGDDDHQRRFKRGIRDFEMNTITHHLDGYVNCTEAEARFWRTGVTLILKQRLDDLRLGGEPWPLLMRTFDEDRR